MPPVHNKGIETLALDVQSSSSLKEAVAQVSDLTEGGLIHSSTMLEAAIRCLMLILMSPKRKPYSTSTFSHFSAPRRAFLPLRLNSSSAMFISGTSVVGVTSLRFQSVYNASKGAAPSMTDMLKLELAPFGHQSLLTSRLELSRPTSLLVAKPMTTYVISL